MDKLNGLNVAYFTCKTIQEFSKTFPQYQKDNKFIEIFIGCVISKINLKNTGVEFLVGVPLKQESKPADTIDTVSLNELLENKHMIDDTDTDIVLSVDGKPNSPFSQIQLTRLVSYRNKAFDLSQLKSLIEKKSRIETDKRLILVINIEERISINVDELYEFFKGSHIPYGKILLVGKTSNNILDFKIYEIFPEIAEYCSDDLER